MTLGAKLQKLRKARGWTQEQLAEKMGVSRQSLSKWESDAALPDTANVIALADLFGVTTDYLLREADAQPTRQPSAQEGASPAQSRSWQVMMSPRELGARLMVGMSAAGLCVLRCLSSVYPADVVIDNRYYAGFAGFLQHYDLWWLLFLLSAVLALGLVQWFGPWLLRQVKRMLKWIQQDAPGDDGSETE